MATPYTPLTNSSSSSSSSSSPAPSNSSSTTGGIFNNSGSLTSLYLYTFIATLSLLLVIFGAFVARSIQMRRRRNAAFLAAVAAGTYVPPPQNGKRRDDPLLPKPMLWEVLIAPGAPARDPEKGWAEIHPITGATLVPVTRQIPRPLRRVLWSPRRLLRFGRRPQFTRPPAAPDLTLLTTVTTGLSSPLELPAQSPSPPLPPSEPVRVAVLISMPTRNPRRAEHEIRGAPVVEFGVAHVSYAHPAGS